MTSDRMVHMTSTGRCWSVTECWHVECRCGWGTSLLPTLEAAREAGDAHLGQANGWGAE